MEENIEVKIFYNVVLHHLDRDNYGNYACFRGAKYYIPYLKIKVPKFEKQKGLGDWKYTWERAYEINKIQEAELLFEEAYSRFISEHKDDNDYATQPNQKRNWYLVHYSPNRTDTSEWFVSKDKEGKDWRLIREPEYSSVDNEVRSWSSSDIQELVSYTEPGGRTVLFKEPRQF